MTHNRPPFRAKQSGFAPVAPYAHTSVKMPNLCAQILLIAD
ncbi:hypothetical protein SUBVAR_04659 [Subdoligranulum variabile DSM 15176]|uniref:Uncharacterized protein n=1 Tax=Subdoligranulum variabile DSM 15176 TaxID=411471 RepID=D1PJT9_9FIRM|nr:hypothetical protein SUBVAR_04659 [Subdoligranulum variabile DSM 15176]